MLQTITWASKQMSRSKQWDGTHKRPELLGDGAVAFRVSCGLKDGTATPTPYIMSPWERGIPSNAVSLLQSFIRFFAGRSKSEEFVENGASSHCEDSDTNQGRWKNLPHGCSGGFSLWFQVLGEVMRRAAAQRSGSGGWNACVQHRSTASGSDLHTRLGPSVTSGFVQHEIFGPLQERVFYMPTRKYLV